MSSLLSTSEISRLTGIFYQHWQTFSQFNTITINKEPIQTITNTGIDGILPGYGNSSQETNITYTARSQTFNAIVKYYNTQPRINMTDLHFDLAQGQAQIKVDQSARDYIMDGTKTENVVLNNIKYNLLSDEKIQNYLGLKFMYFLLERVD